MTYFQFLLRCITILATFQHTLRSNLSSSPRQIFKLVRGEGRNCLGCFEFALLGGQSGPFEAIFHLDANTTNVTTLRVHFVSFRKDSF